jgi:HAD superfamily hydrolase (TIGR01509 family)
VRKALLRLVIFDCDGVLVDSESVANRVTATVVSRLGWRMTPEESRHHFLGMALSDMCAVIEARVGSLPPDFVEDISTRLVEALAYEAEPMPGAMETLREMMALGLPYRVASNSSRAEMAVKFARTGLASLVEGRLHSAEDIIARGGRGKPAPDIYLAAAAAGGVRPEECLVVEDSVPGVRAAVAAGMECLGLATEEHGAALRAVGASFVISTLAELPLLLRDRMARAPREDVA